MAENIAQSSRGKNVFRPLHDLFFVGIIQALQGFFLEMVGRYQVDGQTMLVIKPDR